MTLVRTSSGAWLNADAAASYEAMNDAFRAHFGRNLWISSGARTYAEQVAIFTTNNTTTPTRYSNGQFVTRKWQGRTWYLKPGYATAAVPGTSNHEYPPGRAADFGSGVATRGSAEHNWMRAHAWLWGWVWTGEHFVTIEPWHWEKIGATTAATDSKPFEAEEEVDMDADDKRIAQDTLDTLIAVKAALLDGYADTGFAKSRLDVILENTSNTIGRILPAGATWDQYQLLRSDTTAILAALGKLDTGGLDAVEVGALAAAIREGLGAEVASELAKRLTE